MTEERNTIQGIFMPDAGMEQGTVPPEATTGADTAPEAAAITAAPPYEQAAATADAAAEATAADTADVAAKATAADTTDAAAEATAADTADVAVEATVANIADVEVEATAADIADAAAEPELITPVEAELTVPLVAELTLPDDITQPEGEAEPETPKAEERRAFNFLKDVLGVVVSAVVIAAALKAFVVDSRIVPTGSMIPTIDIGDRVIILKLPYYFGTTPEHKDVVVFAAPDEFESKEDLLKRVIGLPGDTVEVSDGLVYVNGQALVEPYINEVPVKDYGPVTVPEDCYFMLGDNRNHSRDSRMWDDPYVPFSDIKGKVLLCYWPVSHWRLIN